MIDIATNQYFITDTLLGILRYGTVFLIFLWRRSASV